MARKLLRGRARLLKQGKVYIERDTLMYEAKDAHDRTRRPKSIPWCRFLAVTIHMNRCNVIVVSASAGG
jgi:hypothetical protein